MDSKEWAERAEKIDKEMKTTFSGKIERLINDHASVYNSFEDIAYYAMENAMPIDDVWSEETLKFYAQGLESLIME